MSEAVTSTLLHIIVWTVDTHRAEKHTCYELKIKNQLDDRKGNMLLTVEYHRAVSVVVELLS